MTTRYHEYEQASEQCQPLLDTAINECKDTVAAATAAREKADALFWDLLDNVTDQGGIAAGTVVGACWGTRSALACMATLWAALKTVAMYQEGSDFQAMLEKFIHAEEERFEAEAAEEQCAQSSASLYDEYYKCFEHFSPKVHWMDASPGMPADPPLPDE